MTDEATRHGVSAPAIESASARSRLTLHKADGEAREATIQDHDRAPTPGLDAARALAQLWHGDTPDIDMAPYAIDRFQRRSSSKATSA